MRKRFLFMAALISICILLVLHFAPAEEKTLQVRKQPEIEQVRPGKPVRIHVRRSAEGKYTWDLTGDDVDQIVKADKRLKKLLNIK